MSKIMRGASLSSPVFVHQSQNISFSESGWKKWDCVCGAAPLLTLPTLTLILTGSVGISLYIAFIVFLFTLYSSISFTVMVLQWLSVKCWRVGGSIYRLIY
jgi:hypothetical protein